MDTPYFLGIDVGTQGARVVLVDGKGNLTGSSEQAFPLSESSREEQSPDVWWEACLGSLKTLIGELKGNAAPGMIRAVAVTSTSGTVIPLDAGHRPLHHAIMYSDKRSAGAAARCREAALRFHPEGYTHFNASSGLSKMVWFGEQFPEQASRIAHWIHASDYITGMLCGVWEVTDHTNALKSGYDLENLEWPSYLWEALPLKRPWLQRVVASGTPIAPVRPALMKTLGLSGQVQVVAGMTDGCASQIASGAMAPGEWNTTIGTTLVIKGVTTGVISDPEGRLYCHRHPDADLPVMGEEGTAPPRAAWMPGGASNTGADWITGEYGMELDRFNEAALKLLPTGKIAWPLRQKGERFPFIAPEATGFAPEGLPPEELFTANMEGVAYIERMAYEMISRLSGERVKAVYTAGGGSNSEPWLIIRSNVLNLPLYKMKYVTGAVGAAILAASKTYYGSVGTAVKAMTQLEKMVRPTPALVRRYDAGYREFVSVLRTKGYLGS